MKIGTRDIMACSREVLIFLIRNTYRSACEHPFALGMLFFLLILYRFLPYLFGFLLSYSPIIICTMILLGTLLSFGQPNIHEIEEEGKTTHELSPLQVCSDADDLALKKDESFSMKSHIENRENVKGTPLKEANSTEQGDRVHKMEKAMLLSTFNEGEERKDEAVATCSPVDQGKNQIHIEKKATNKREVNGRGLSEKADSHEEFPVQDALKVAELVHLVASGEKESAHLKVEIHEPSSLDSSWKLANDPVSSDSASDCTENQSPGASLTDITAKLDELHPLLDTRAPRPVNVSVIDSHSVTGLSAQDCKSYDDNVEEEVEHQKEEKQEEKNEHPKEEAQEEKDDESTIPVSWTADDETNLMDLSTSILERHRRLANLIAKRRARKNLRPEAENNLIDLDDLSHIPFQIPPISTARRNPFDPPFYPEEIPGSAPSVFLPREDLFYEFDIPFEKQDENGSLTGLSLGHQGSVAVPQRDMFFRRYESFSVGASFIGELPEKHGIDLRPHVATGMTNLNESNYTDFQRQQNEKKNSKVPNVPGSESNSSVVDTEDDELLEQESHRNGHAELIFPCDVEHVEKESVSDEVNFVESQSRETEINICGICEFSIKTLTAYGEETHEAVDDFVENGNQTKHEMCLDAPTSDAADSNVTEVKYMELSSACSLEVSEKNFSTKIEDGSTDVRQSGDSHLNGSNYSVHSLDREGKTVTDIHVVQQAYDSSPSVTGKSLMRIASFEQDLFCGGQDNFRSTLSPASETQTETSDLCLPKLEEKNNLSEFGDFVSDKESTGGMHLSCNGALRVLPSDLPSMQVDDSRSRQASEDKDKSRAGPREVSLPETPLEFMETSKSVHEFESRSLEDPHVSLKQVLKGTTNKSNMETKDILEIQETEGKDTIEESSKGMESGNLSPPLEAGGFPADTDIAFRNTNE